MKRLLLLSAVVFGSFFTQSVQAQFLDSNYVYVSGIIINAPPQMVITITSDGFDPLTVTVVNGNFSLEFLSNVPQGFVEITFADCDNSLFTISQPFIIPGSAYLYFQLTYCGTGTGVFGCTDPIAINFNPFATIDDGSCVYDTTFYYGCTDPNANNYDPWATLDDGSCSYDSCGYNQITVDFITGNWAGEVSWDIISTTTNVVVASGNGYANYSTYSSLICLEDGCYYLNMYDSFGDGWNGGTITLSGNGLIYLNTGLVTGNYGIVPFGINTTFCDSLAIPGCTDPLASNYNPWATLDDGSCLYNTIFGCTDPAAINYDPLATVDDGGCIYNSVCDPGQTMAELYVCTFQNGALVGIEVIGDNGDTVFTQFGFNDVQIAYFDICLDDSVCYTVNMYNSNGFGWYNGYYWININGIQVSTDLLDANLNFESVTFSIDGTCGDIYGCTDPIASNFNPWATVDDGSCWYDTLFTYGCTDPLAFNYNPQAVFDDGSCVYDTLFIFGCTDPAANNYDPWATIDDGSCLYDSCDANLINVQFVSVVWGNEITWEIINSNTNVVVASGGPYPNNYLDLSTICLEDGCYHINMYDSFGDGWNGGSISLGGNGLIYLNTTLASGNFGTVPFGINDNTCDSLWAVPGCTDPLALNYNPWATIEDGSCVYDTVVYGCTDPNASNYNPWANFDDGSCYYDTVCQAWFEVIEIDTVLNVVYIVNTSTVGLQATYYWDFGDGTFSNDPYPTHVYGQDGLYLICLTVTTFTDPFGNLPCTSTFCDTVGFYGIQGGGQLESVDGFTINVLAPPATGIDEIETTDFVLYPNPNAGGFYIKLEGKTLTDVNWQIYDMAGKSIDRGQWANLGNDAQYLDIMSVQNGMYHLEIITGDQRIVKKITVLK